MLAERADTKVFIITAVGCFGNERRKILYKLAKWCIAIPGSSAGVLSSDTSNKSALIMTTYELTGEEPFKLLKSRGGVRRMRAADHGCCFGTETDCAWTLTSFGWDATTPAAALLRRGDKYCEVVAFQYLRHFSDDFSLWTVNHISTFTTFFSSTLCLPSPKRGEFINLTLWTFK